MSTLLDGLISESDVVAPDGTVLEFSIPQATLSKGLGRVESVVSPKDPVAILRNFHITAGAGDVRVIGSDSVLSVIAHLTPSAVSVSGSAVFSATRLSSIVREASHDHDLKIKVVSKKGKLTASVKSGPTKWVIPLMAGDGFPTFPGIEEFGTVGVPREGFLGALQRVKKAMSNDPMRPYLMMVDVSNGKVRASDSIRFQQVKFAFPFDCQIPSRAVQELVNRLSSSTEEEFEVGVSDHALLFRIDGSLLIAQKIMAKFPDVDEVLLKPTLANDQELEVSREALLKAVRRVRITADENTAAVILSLNKGSVSVESKDRRGGTAVESVEAVWENPPRHVSFNHQHLSDMLSSTKSEKCLFRLGKELKTRPTPLLMEDVAEGFTAVLNQIRLDWI